MQRRLPADSAAVFEFGFMVTRVSERRVWDEETRQFGEQEVDKETGRRMFVVEGYDVAAMKAPPVVTKTGHTFRESADRKVLVASDVEPEIPDNEAHGLRGVVQFERLTVTPWLDDKGCRGLQHDDSGGRRRCGCQVKFSYRAYGMVPVRG